LRFAASLVLVSLISACATQREATVPFARAFPNAEHAPPAPLAVPTAIDVTSWSIERVLPAFERAEARTRQLARPGVPMPAAQVDHWRTLLSQVQGLLAHPPAATPIETVHAVASAIERQIDADGRVYGEIPPDLALAVMARQGDLAIRAQQLAQLGPSRPRRERLSWPVTPVTITSLFGRRMHPLLRVVREHDGVDLAASPGQNVLAAASGVVERAGEDGGYGLMVELIHANGVITRYAHLDEILVARGKRVRAGEPIGLAGETGLATGVHLHFEVLRRGRPIDPLTAIGAPKTPHAPAHRGTLVSQVTAADHHS
jgi:murein DD-endopeptidase MepM/ murein hydrolase activator NlpD